MLIGWRSTAKNYANSVDRNRRWIEIEKKILISEPIFLFVNPIFLTNYPLDFAKLPNTYLFYDYLLSFNQLLSLENVLSINIFKYFYSHTQW